MFSCFDVTKLHESIHFHVFSPFNAHFFPPKWCNGKWSIAAWTLCVHFPPYLSNHYVLLPVVSAKSSDVYLLVHPHTSFSATLTVVHTTTSRLPNRSLMSSANSRCCCWTTGKWLSRQTTESTWAVSHSPMIQLIQIISSCLLKLPSMCFRNLNTNTIIVVVLGREQARSHSRRIIAATGLLVQATVSSTSSLWGKTAWGSSSLLPKSEFA